MRTDRDDAPPAGRSNVSAVHQAKRQPAFPLAHHERRSSGLAAFRTFLKFVPITYEFAETDPAGDASFDGGHRIATIPQLIKRSDRPPPRSSTPICPNSAIVFWSVTR